MGLDNGAHLRRLPVRFLGLLRPGKGKMPNLPRLPGFSKNFQASKQDLSLTLSIP